LVAALNRSERGLIVVGPQEKPELATLIARLAQRLGWPVLADPLSQLRFGAHDRSQVIDSYDAFLRDEGFVHAAAPDTILRFGAMPVSKPLLQYLQAHPACEQIVVDGGAGWRDPMLAAAQMVWADPQSLLAALLDRLPNRSGGAWLARWHSAQRATRATLTRLIDGFDEPFEGRVFAELATILPDRAALVIGNSMPIRDADTFLAGGPRTMRVFGNRGVNGIDGTISTALGIAAAGGDPTVLVLGDLALIHDLNGLLAAKLHALNLTIVVINNDGGGIFSFLPQAAYPEHFERVFGTPHGLDFAPVAQLFGGSYTRCADWSEFRAAIATGLQGGLHLVEVRTDRARNVALHRALWPAVGAALEHAQ
jgi:2-succinyl-5-enolpyruvyl-6-hydroxy-3-cyclohexene-1-carboxylate synthase